MSVANKVEIQYTEPRFHRRIFANLLDFVIFIFCTIGLFIATRGIVSSTPGYSANINRILEIRSDSGLYVVTSGTSDDLISFINANYSGWTACSYADDHIDQFILYLNEEIGEGASKTVQEDYDKFRLEAVKDGVHYFVKNDGGEIIANSADPSFPGWANCYSDVYVPFVDEHTQGYLVTLIPEYLELIRWESVMLLAVEAPIAYLLAGVITYLIPPLCLKRGKMTLGKAMYHIGLADSRLLSCSWKRYLARWFILFFGEFVLSIFTFGIPFLISFTLMAFSKKHQGFPDYILGLYEVDCSDNKLYMSYEEITLSGVGGEKKPIDFKMIKED